MSALSFKIMEGNTQKIYVEHFTSFVVLRDLLDFGKQQQHINIVLKKVLTFLFLMLV